jgi:hypothetical protein
MELRMAYPVHGDERCHIEGEIYGPVSIVSNTEEPPSQFSVLEAKPFQQHSVLPEMCQVSQSGAHSTRHSLMVPTPSHQLLTAIYNNHASTPERQPVSRFSPPMMLHTASQPSCCPPQLPVHGTSQAPPVQYKIAIPVADFQHFTARSVDKVQAPLFPSAGYNHAHPEVTYVQQHTCPDNLNGVGQAAGQFQNDANLSHFLQQVLPLTSTTTAVPKSKTTSRTSSEPGIRQSRTNGRYDAHITIPGVGKSGYVHLGTFEDVEVARTVRQRAM